MEQSRRVPRQNAELAGQGTTTLALWVGIPPSFPRTPDQEGVGMGAEVPSSKALTKPPIAVASGIRTAP